MGEIELKDLRPSKIKWLLTEKFIKSYWKVTVSAIAEMKLDTEQTMKLE